jgi:peptidoglycan/LPS O-acetylase OafA/YrhL
LAYNLDYEPVKLNKSIDIIRGAAALGVIWGHSISSTSRLPIQLNGAFWVWIFFSISGYLVGRGFIGGSYALSLSGIRCFLTNRALRIIPLAYTALGIGVMVNYINDTKMPVTTLSQFLFISPLNDMSLSGPLWSVATEIQFYLAACFLVPLVCLVFRRGGELQVRFFLVACCGLSI